MRTRITIFSFLCILLLGATVFAQTDTVTVHFLISTASSADTLGTASTVQIRGSMLPLTWDYLTGCRAVQIEGDYWMGTTQFLLNRGDTARVRYKSSLTTRQP